ncbi:MAG: hypothetical protein ABR583_06935 [Gaiellaceae bacterium]
MTTVVVPFSGPRGKRRFAPLPPARRSALAHAMLADVLAAAVPVGRTLVVTPSDAEQAHAVADAAGAEVLEETGHGQSDAVSQALQTVRDGPVLIVNADLPCARPPDLLALLGLLPAGGLAIVEALDGTTNALALSSPRLWEPLYGAGSAARFLRYAEGLGLPAVAAALPNLADDADTPDALAVLAGRLGPHTAAALARPPAVAA